MSRLRLILSILSLLLILSILIDYSIESVFNYKFKIDEVLLFCIIFTGFLSLPAYYPRPLYLTKLDLTFLLLIASLIISSVLNPNFQLLQSTAGIYFLIKGLLLFFFIQKVGINKKYINYIINIIIYFSIINVMAQLLQIVNPNIGELTIGLIENPDIHKSYFRCGGVLGNANQSAQLYIISYLLLRIKRVAFTTFKVYIILLGVLLTGSKLGIIIFLIIIIIDLLFIYQKIKYIVPLLGVLCLFIFYWGSSFLFRLEQLHQQLLIEGTYFRLESYKISFQVLSDHPLFGVGPGFYGGSVAAIFGGSPYHDAYGTFDYYKNYTINHPNTLDTFWAHLWAETGIIGFLFFLLIFVQLVLRCLQLGIKLELNKFKYLALLLGAFLLSGISMMAIEATFSSIIVYVIAGGILSHSK